MDTKKAAFSAALTFIDINYTVLLQKSKVSMDRIKNYSQSNNILWGNIPEVLLDQPRWVPLNNGVPIRDWSNPANQTLPDNNTMAFDISSHSAEYADYLLMDWDHYNIIESYNNKYSDLLYQ